VGAQARVGAKFDPGAMLFPGRCSSQQGASCNLRILVFGRKDRNPLDDIFSPEGAVDWRPDRRKYKSEENAR